MRVLEEFKLDDVILLACAAEYDLNDEALSRMQVLLEKVEHLIADEDAFVGERVYAYGRSMGWIKE
jgi:hypothetical protein